MFEFVVGVVVGFSPIAYAIYRALKSDGWDNSNVMNWFRVFSQLAIHPEDFGKMYYLDSVSQQYLEAGGFLVKKPFNYISGDEFADNFPSSRP